MLLLIFAHGSSCVPITGNGVKRTYSRRLLIPWIFSGLDRCLMQLAFCGMLDFPRAARDVISITSPDVSMCNNACRFRGNTLLSSGKFHMVIWYILLPHA